MKLAWMGPFQASKCRTQTIARWQDTTITRKTTVAIVKIGDCFTGTTVSEMSPAEFAAFVCVPGHSASWPSWSTNNA